MVKFIPKEKLSKKAKCERNQAQRQTWGAVNPVTRKADSKKSYKREKPSLWFNDNSTRVFLLRLQSRV